MRIVKRGEKPKEQFTLVPNGIWTDPRLSVESRSLLGYLLSLPPDWDTDREKIAQKIGVGAKRVATRLQELEEAGYVERKQTGPRDWILYISCLSRFDTSRNDGKKDVPVSNQHKQNVPVSNVPTQNRHTTNKTDSTKTDKRKKKYVVTRRGSKKPRGEEGLLRRAQVWMEKNTHGEFPPSLNELHEFLGTDTPSETVRRIWEQSL